MYRVGTIWLSHAIPIHDNKFAQQKKCGTSHFTTVYTTSANRFAIFGRSSKYITTSNATNHLEDSVYYDTTNFPLHTTSDNSKRTGHKVATFAAEMGDFKDTVPGHLSSPTDRSNITLDYGRKTTYVWKYTHGAVTAPFDTSPTWKRSFYANNSFGVWEE